MVAILRNVVVTMKACQVAIIATAQAIFAYKRTVMSYTSTYVSTSSLIADCFPESTITLDIGSINGRSLCWCLLCSLT